MPWSGQNRKLLDESEGLVTWVLVLFAGDATVNEVFNVSMDVGPSVSRRSKSSVRFWPGCPAVGMLELENAGAEVARVGTDVGNIYTVVDEKEAGVRDGVAGIG